MNATLSESGPWQDCPPREPEGEGGRPRSVDQKKVKAALSLKNDKDHIIKEICQILGISRNTYYMYVSLGKDEVTEK